MACMAAVLLLVQVQEKKDRDANHWSHAVHEQASMTLRQGLSDPEFALAIPCWKFPRLGSCRRGGNADEPFNSDICALWPNRAMWPDFVV